ncbi:MULTISPECIES: hypothetical protein [Bacillales]|uniref:YtzI protein n=1 Tax=Lysinibacillus louembei TaxID=1470088 RepID=A0ABZ0RTI6_9BACI|nr:MULTISPECIES: hypothetical protein [Bacillales]MCT6925031.1 hypothetical protein [Metasolibacillus sp.]MCT6941276.1 hypothetical protein [Metasolibacillus sp.]WPK10511.1 hypothetical protein R6U77_11505 [Lysinibacillus louembei]
MSLPLVFIIVIAIMATFAIAIILIARQNNFSTKQTIDPMPTKSQDEHHRK